MEYPIYWTLIGCVRDSVEERYERHFKYTNLTVENTQTLIEYLQKIEKVVEFLENEPKTPATEEK